MSIIGSRDQIGVKLTGTSVTVADNPTARLMYYFDCLMNVLEVNNSEIRRFTNYQSYNNLDNSDKRMLLKLCEEFDPDTLMEKGIFCRVDDIPNNHLNEFIEITHTNTTLIANESMLIGGQRVRAKNIMIFKQSWLNRNYYEPLRKLKDELESSSCSIL